LFLLLKAKMPEVIAGKAKTIDQHPGDGFCLFTYLPYCPARIECSFA
jgi:hypothetical protein